MLAAENIKVWPNPFNTSFTISYELKQPGTIQFMICNQFGQQVGIIEQNQAVGKQQVTWNARGLAPGVYYCMLRSEKGMKAVKLIKL